jgi:hypothetical protein
MRHRSRAVLIGALGCLVLLCTCRRAAPILVHGAARLEWDQTVGYPDELRRYRFIAYVDNEQYALATPDCVMRETAAHFTCSAALPALPPGRHTLRLAARELDGLGRESGKSAAVRVVVIQPPPDTDRQTPTRSTGP